MFNILLIRGPDSLYCGKWENYLKAYSDNVQLI